ncbi:DUF6174 domain-containing protein [Streptomyces sp. NPDC001595]|uniref:DUF6174 domain-containing protein n=1 Tax=Streptomyces sp. NPDC001532 TaxID=3154520 RepID=UPI00332A423A
MTAVRRTARSRLTAALLTGALLAVVSACAGEASNDPGDGGPRGGRGGQGDGGTGWVEPDAYSFTLRSSEGERSLLGTFRVTVRDGEVADAVGLDESGRRVVARLPGEVPTLGELLAQVRQARHDGVYAAETEYAADGHPVRVFLDGERDAVDDEALYVISDYELPDTA